MEENVKHLIGLVYVGLLAAVVILVIDYQMKQQILRESMHLRGNIKILDQAGRFYHDTARVSVDRSTGNVGTRDFDSASDDPGVETASVDIVNGYEDEQPSPE